MRNASVVAVAVASGVLVVAVGAVVVMLLLPQADSAEDAVSVRSTQSPGEVAEYWTEERMERASPG